MKGRQLAIAALGVCGFIGLAAPAWGDAVTDWNEIAQAAIVTGRPGPIGAVDSALVQVAVHDAVQAIDRRFEPYHVEVEGAKGSRSAAAASLDATYFNYLATHGLSNDPGLPVGEKVAAGILPLRRVDPNPPAASFTGGTGIGQWRPTPSFIGNPPAPIRRRRRRASPTPATTTK